jgi:transposase
MDAARFIEFCKGMLHDIDRPIFLIVDGSSVHKAAKVKDFVASTDGRLQLFFLPSYSPQLNSDEWVWKNVKHDGIARKVPQSKADLKAIAHGGLRRLQQLPDTVQGFFRGNCSGTRGVQAAGRFRGQRRSRLASMGRRRDGAAERRTD